MSNQKTARLQAIAREVEYIHDEVGFDRFRLGKGKPPANSQKVPVVDLPDWSDASTIRLARSPAFKRCQK